MPLHIHTHNKYQTTTCSACFTTEQWLCISHGRKQYELSNHLGNVLATITDKLIGIDTNNNQLIDYYSADPATQQSYYPFGMIMPGRSYSAATYNFGFNGQIKDDEISGTGNLMTAQFWEYDTRLGRRWNLDPVVKPWESGYACFSNNPIYIVDLYGNEGTDPGGHTETDPCGNEIQLGDGIEISDDGNILINTRNGTDCEGGWDQGTYNYDTEEYDVNYNNTCDDNATNQNSSEANEVFDWQDLIPVWGACRLSSKYLNNGDYLSAIGFFGLGIFEAYTLGAGMELRLDLEAAKTSTTVLEGAVKSNYGRFVSKIPANSKSSASFQLLDDGNYLFQATSPGKVPGSSALYQKWVNPQGETFKMIKTTFAPDGSIIHVKPKF